MGTRYLILSFDDGTVYDRRLADLVRHYRMKATWNLNSARFGLVIPYLQNGIPSDRSQIGAQELLEVYAGQELAAHGLDHRNLTLLDDDRVFVEMEEDRRNLIRKSGMSVIGCAYPDGAFDARVQKVLQTRTGICYARTANCTYEFDLPTDFYAWDPTVCADDAGLFLLAERFLAEETEEDSLFFVYGQSYRFEQLRTWDRFEMFLRMMAYRKDLCVLTCGEYYALQHPAGDSAVKTEESGQEYEK